MKKKPISHRAAIRFICENLEDTTPGSERCRAIRSHIEECPDCLRRLEELKKTIRLYQEYPAPALSAATKKRLRERLGLA